MSVSIIEDAGQGKDFGGVRKGDVVILPAFGASVQEMQMLNDREVELVDTTCPWVSKVCVPPTRDEPKSDDNDENKDNPCSHSSDDSGLVPDSSSQNDSDSLHSCRALGPYSCPALHAVKQVTLESFAGSWFGSRQHVQSAADGLRRTEIHSGKAYAPALNCLSWLHQVWTAVDTQGRKRHTSIIHGKWAHEETIATASFATTYLIVKNLPEAQCAPHHPQFVTLS